MKNLYAIAEAVRSNRAEEYGDHGSEGGLQVSTGKLWAAILNTHYPNLNIPAIPPYVVELMLLLNKVNRAAIPDRYDEDDFIDIINYAGLSYNTHPLKKPICKSKELEI